MNHEREVIDNTTVRERAKQVIELLHDDKRIKGEREKAKSNRDKYKGVGGDGRSGSYLFQLFYLLRTFCVLFHHSHLFPSFFPFSFNNDMFVHLSHLIFEPLFSFFSFFVSPFPFLFLLFILFFTIVHLYCCCCWFYFLP